MKKLHVPKVDVYSLFYGAGLILVFVGSVNIDYDVALKHAGTLAVAGVGFLAMIRLLSRHFPRGSDLPAFIALVALVLLSLFGIKLEPTRANYLYAQYFTTNLSAFAIVMILLPSRQRVVTAVVTMFTAALAFVALLQLTYLFFGVGMDPMRVQVAEDMPQLTAYAAAAVRSFYVNQNDMAVICCLLTLYYLYGCDISARARLVACALLSGLVVLSGSRSCLVAMTLILVLYYLTNIKKLLWFGGILALLSVGFSWIVSASGRSLGGSYFAAKIATIVAIAGSYMTGGFSAIGDNSISERLSTYLEFFNGFGAIGVGSYSAHDYGYFIKNNWLMAQDPHSLMMELSLLYGYVGFVIFCVIMWWIYKSLKLSNGFLVALSTALTITLLGFVSSSSIGNPSFWVLIFAISGGARMAKKSEILMRRPGEQGQT